MRARYLVLWISAFTALGFALRIGPAPAQEYACAAPGLHDGVVVCDGSGAPLGHKGGLFGVRLDLNRATVKDLERISGIGPKTAEKIVAHRAANGPFATVEGLLEVKGIGPKKLAKIRATLTVNR